MTHISHRGAALTCNQKQWPVTVGRWIIPSPGGVAEPSTAPLRRVQAREAGAGVGLAVLGKRRLDGIEPYRAISAAATRPGGAGETATSRHSSPGQTEKPPLRSRSTAERTDPFGSEGRGNSQRSVGRRFSPRLGRPFLSRSFRCSGREAEPIRGRNRAMELPCSVITTSSPALTH